MAEDAAPRQEGESIENIVSDETRRATWSGKAAFIIASAAASIGLGNLWRFPSLAAKYGGGMFVLTYIVLVCTLGFAYLLTETAIGRRTRKSGIAAFVAMARENGRKGGLGWKVLGSLEIIVPAIIVPYYCTIGGWITKYMVEYALGGSDVLSATDASGAPTFFGQFITSDSEPVAWTFIFCILVVLVIVLGVNNGIEKLNKYAMPALLFLAIAVMIYGLVTIPNAGAGVAYYLVPKFQDFSVMTIVAAAGQMFYSLSLGMGIMITYGSYMRREEHMESGVGSIAFFDTLVAVIAGFIVIPATFSLFGPEATRQAGAGRHHFAGLAHEGDFAAALGIGVLVCDKIIQEALLLVLQDKAEDVLRSHVAVESLVQHRGGPVVGHHAFPKGAAEAVVGDGYGRYVYFHRPVVSVLADASEDFPVAAVGRQQDDAVGLFVEGVERLGVVHADDALLAESFAALGSLAAAEPDRLGEHRSQIAVELLADPPELVIFLVRETPGQVDVHHVAPVVQHAAGEPAQGLAAGQVEPQRQRSERPHQAMHDMVSNACHACF